MTTKTKTKKAHPQILKNKAKISEAGQDAFLLSCFGKKGYAASQNPQLLMQYLKSSVADYETRKLSEETRKGMNAKADHGWYPGRAPWGYCNARGNDGRSVIVVDPKLGPVMKDVFEEFSTGRLSVEALLRRFRDRVIGLPGVPRVTHESSLFHRLSNPFYVGKFVWNEKVYQGNHLPLVSQQVFDRVQANLARQVKDKTAPRQPNQSFH